MGARSEAAKQQRGSAGSMACSSTLLTRIQSSELFTMTYGALVIQLIKDYQDYGEVNKQLEKM